MERYEATEQLLAEIKVETNRCKQMYDSETSYFKRYIDVLHMFKCEQCFNSRIEGWFFHNLTDHLLKKEE